jgi:hypothetical protein|eukprot:SAG25_NODE_6617_length_545_cov_0.831839_1_plen_52_part_00
MPGEQTKARKQVKQQLLERRSQRAARIEFLRQIPLFADKLHGELIAIADVC